MSDVPSWGRTDQVDQAQDNGQQTVYLNRLFRLIQEADKLEQILPDIERNLLELLQAERMTLYRVDGEEIVSWFLTGQDLDDAIRVPIGPSSLAGYVAMSGDPIRIHDVYNTDELAAIHPKLSFDYSFDQISGFITESMIVVPIKHNERLLGVMQIINRRAGGAFSDQDVIHAIAVSQLISDKFRRDLKGGVGPFEYLIKNEFITLERYEEVEADAFQRGIPVTILLRRQERIPIEEIGIALRDFYRVPFMGYDERISPDHEMLDALNRSYLANQNWVPFRGENGQVIVLIDDPSNTDRVMEAKQLVNDPNPELRVGTKEDILRYLGYAYPEDEDRVDQDLESIVGQLDQSVEADAAVPDEEELLDENASAIIQLVNHIIIESVTRGASDIHIEPMKGKNDARVRIRIDGECIELLKVPYTHIRAVISRVKVLAHMDITERRRPQDGKISVRMGGERQELRICTMPTVNGETAVMRVLASGGKAMSVEALGLSRRNFERVEESLEHPHGIFLCVGPTGSGKTTTLHAMVGKINTVDRKILTAEDPVEITQPRLQQLQVNARIGLTFAAAMKSFLRADPDVILIGEMRDHETAAIGVEASLTGHLVFSTLHTNSASETVVRLLDMGLDPMNFADALIAVLAQRLMRTLCKRCKEEYQPTADELNHLIHLYGEDHFAELNLEPGKIRLCRPKGCENCLRTGYRGRMGIHELLMATPEMKEIIARKGSTVPEIRGKAAEDGMRTLMQDGIHKVIQGMSTLEQLRKVTVA